MESVKLTIGEKNPFNKPLEEGAIVELNENGLMLNIYLSHLTQNEINSIRVNVPIKLALTKYKDILFFCIRMGALEWLECPFHAGLYNIRYISLMEEDKTTGLTIILTEHTNNIIKATRLKSLPIECSKTIWKYIDKQQQAQISRETYNRQIDEAYNKYPCGSIYKDAEKIYEF